MALIGYFYTVYNGLMAGFKPTTSCVTVTYSNHSSHTYSSILNLIKRIIEVYFLNTFYLELFCVQLGFTNFKFKIDSRMHVSLEICLSNSTYTFLNFSEASIT
jgi:hypothetical protein